MINALWLILIIPLSVFFGVMLMSMLTAAKCEDCRAKYKAALRVQYEEIKKGDNNENA